MKYLLPLLFLVGCESFPEERPKPEYIEMPIIDTHVEDGVKIAPYNEEERIDKVQLGPFDLYWEPPILEIDLVSITDRRFMLYLEVIRN